MDESTLDHNPSTSLPLCHLPLALMHTLANACLPKSECNWCADFAAAPANVGRQPAPAKTRRNGDFERRTAAW